MSHKFRLQLLPHLIVPLAFKLLTLSWTILNVIYVLNGETGKTWVLGNCYH